MAISSDLSSDFNILFSRLSLSVPQPVFQEVEDRLTELLHATTDGETSLHTSIQTIITFIKEYEQRFKRRPLLEAIVYTSADLYKIFGRSHIASFPDTLTAQFAVRKDFPLQELFRAIYTLREKFRQKYPSSTTLPVVLSSDSKNTKAVQFGLLATIQERALRVTFEFVTEKEQECFSYIDSVQFRQVVEGRPSLYAPFGTQKWLEGISTKYVDLPERSACQTEKLLDFLRMGFSLSPYAIRLFNQEYGDHPEALDMLFERVRFGKATPDALVDLFHIVSLLDSCNRVPFFLRSCDTLALQPEVTRLLTAIFLGQTKEVLTSFREVLKVTPEDLCPFITAEVNKLCRCPSAVTGELTDYAYLQLLFRSPNPDCRGVALELFLQLAEKEQKALIKSCAQSDPQLATRLIGHVSRTDEDITHWVALCTQKPVLFEALTRLDDLRWVPCGLDCALEVYRALPQIGLLEEITSHEAGRTIDTARAWLARHREERKQKSERLFPLLLLPEVAKELPQFIVETIEDVETLAPTSISQLRTSFQKVVQGINDPMALLHFVMLYETMCRGTLSDKIRERVRDAYKTLSQVPPRLAAWYAALPSPTVGLSALMQQKKWVEAARYVQGHPGEGNESKAGKIINGLLLQDDPDPKKLFFLTATFCCTQTSLWEKAIAHSSLMPDAYAEGLRLFLGAGDKITPKAKKAIWNLFVKYVTPQGIACSHPHFGALYNRYGEIQDIPQKRKLGWALLTLCDKIDSSQFPQCVALMRTALEDSQMPFEAARVSFDSFLKACTRQYQNPFDCAEYKELIKRLAEPEDPQVEDFFAKHLASLPLWEHYAQFATKIALAYTRNLQDSSLEGRVCDIIERGRFSDRLHVYTALFFPNVSRPKATLSDRVLATLTAHYPRLFALAFIDAGSAEAGALLTLHVMDVPELQTAKKVIQIDHCTPLFMRSFAPKGWDTLHKHLFDKLLHVLMPESGSAGCFYREDPVTLHEHYPVEGDDAYWLMRTIHMLAAEGGEEVETISRQHAQLLIGYIEWGIFFVNKVEGIQRASLLNNVVFMLLSLIEYHPTSNRLEELVRSFYATIPKGDPLYDVHNSMTHVIVCALYQNGIEIDIDYEESPALLTATPQKLREQSEIRKILRNITIWQQHQKTIDFETRHTLVLPVLQNLARCSDVNIIQNTIIQFRALFLPTSTRCRDGDSLQTIRACFDTYFALWDSLAKSCQNDAAYILTLSPIQIQLLSLFALLSNSSAFTANPSAFEQIARQFMARLNSKTLLACCSFTNALLSHFKALNPKEHILLVNDWLSKLMLIEDEVLKNDAILNFKEGVTRSSFLEKFTENERPILESWQRAFASLK